MNDDDQDGCPGKRSVAPPACDSPWLDPRIAEQQRELVDRQLAERPWPVHFTVLADAVNAISPDGRVLEIGCGVGHGLEIIDQRSDLRHYCGVDISAAAIAKAKERYCKGGPVEFYDCARWIVAESNDSWSGEEAEIVLDSSCVLHVDSWRAHLAAICAASRDAVILHRIPIGEFTDFSTTQGYGRVFDSWIFSLADVREVMRASRFEHTETRKADGDSLTLTFRKRNR